MIDHLRGAGFRVGLVTVHHGAGHDAELRARVDRLWTLRPSGSDTRWRGLARRLRRAVPSWLARRVPRLRPPRPSSYILRKINPSLCRLAARAARSARPAAMIAEFAWTARALDRAPPGTLRILDTHDIQHRRRETARSAGGDLADRACTRDEEIAELRRADVLLAIQRHEARVLEEMCPERRVMTVEHGLRLARPLPSPADSRLVLFVGNLYEPNVLGLRDFFEHAWPDIRVAVPEAELAVCGRVCEAFEEAPEGARLEGVVPDLTPYYASAAVVINPVPYGSGLKIKSVEAIALGKALVATPGALVGLEDADPPPCLLAPEARRMGAAVAVLLCDVARRRDLEARARRLTKSRFAPERAYGPLERLLREEGRRDAAPPGR